MTLLRYFATRAALNRDGRKLSMINATAPQVIALSAMLNTGNGSSHAVVTVTIVGLVRLIFAIAAIVRDGP